MNAASPMAKGFVYILSNTAFPGLLKIGFTRKVPSERAAELDTTGVPSPFVVEYYCLVEGDSQLESAVHRVMAGARHRGDREFFRIDVREAIRHIQQACPRPEHVWTRVPASPKKDKNSRPASVKCPGCEASYVSAVYCPKCRIKLSW